MLLFVTIVARMYHVQLPAPFRAGPTSRERITIIEIQVPAPFAAAAARARRLHFVQSILHHSPITAREPEPAEQQQQVHLPATKVAAPQSASK